MFKLVIWPTQPFQSGAHWAHLPPQAPGPDLARAGKSPCVACASPAADLPVPQQHVQDGRKENLEGFVRTFQKELPEDSHAGVFALDCEMVSRVLETGPLWEDEEVTLAEMQGFHQ